MNECVHTHILLLLVFSVPCSKEKNTFEVVTPTRTFCIAADSEADLDDWIKAFNSVLRPAQQHEVSPWAFIHIHNYKKNLPLFPSFVSERIQVGYLIIFPTQPSSVTQTKPPSLSSEGSTEEITYV